MEEPRALPVVRDPVELSVASSPTRCPYCHGPFAEPDLPLACARCLARHHVACWNETASCAACRGPDALVPQRRRNLHLPVGAAFLAGLLVGAFGSGYLERAFLLSLGASLVLTVVAVLIAKVVFLGAAAVLRRLRPGTARLAAALAALNERTIRLGLRTARRHRTSG